MKHRSDEIDSVVGLRIRTRREQLGLTQTKVGEALGVSFQQVQKYESGHNRVSAGRLTLLSRILMVPATYFFEMDSEQLSHEIDVVRHGDRYTRRLLSVFNRLTDDQKRKKVVEIFEAIIDAIDASDDVARESSAETNAFGRSGDENP